MKANELVQYPVNEGYSVVIYMIMVINIVLLSLLFGYYREQTKKIMVAAVDKKSKGNLKRNDSDIVQKVSVYLNITFFISLVLFLYSIDYRLQTFNIIKSFNIFYFSIAIVAFFILKYFVHQFLAQVFKTTAMAEVYLEESYLKYKLFGIFLFPVVLVIMYSKTLYLFAMAVGLIGFLLTWILKSYSGFIIGLNTNNFPKHYSFLYICTLEIMPLAILCKIFSKPIASLLQQLV